MKKPITLILILLALVLTACQAQATPPTGATPATSLASDTPGEAPSPSPEIEQLASPTAPAVTEMVGPEAPPGCTVVSQTSASSGDSPFPEISAEDWVHGPDDAYVSLIEYGDFQ